MSKVAGVIPFKAKPGRGTEVARLIAAAQPYVEREPGTTLWMVLQSSADPDMVFLVDRFKDEQSREAHMNGQAAKLIFQTVLALLTDEPQIHPANLIASKVAA